MGKELPRRGRDVAMVTTLPFLEVQGECFPNGEGDGERASQKRKGCGHGHNLTHPEEGECVAMVTTSQFPEEIPDSFPNEEEDGEGVSQKRKGCGHGHT